MITLRLGAGVSLEDLELDKSDLAGLYLLLREIRNSISSFDAEFADTFEPDVSTDSPGVDPLLNFYSSLRHQLFELFDLLDHVQSAGYLQAQHAQNNDSLNVLYKKDLLDFIFARLQLFCSQTKEISSHVDNSLFSTDLFFSSLQEEAITELASKLYEQSSLLHEKSSEFHALSNHVNQLELELEQLRLHANALESQYNSLLEEFEVFYLQTTDLQMRIVNENYSSTELRNQKVARIAHSAKKYSRICRAQSKLISSYERMVETYASIICFSVFGKYKN